MGHLYPSNISLLMVELQERNGGFTTLREVVARMGIRRIGVECAEGVYDSREMREMAAETTLYWHGFEEQVSFKPQNKEQRAALKSFSGNDDEWYRVVMLSRSSRYQNKTFRGMYDCPFHLKTHRKGFSHPQHIES